MKNLKHILVFISISAYLLISTFAFAQSYIRTDTIPVKENGNWLKFPWVGGHNYVQLSAIDMNFDGIKDLFVFDRTGHKTTAYINGGTPNTVDYYDSTAKYASKFPHLEDWVLIRDYNCDGLPDIFTYAITIGGIKVWRNTSTAGNLQFTLQTNYIQSDYTPTVTTDPLTNLFVSRVDIPTIDDVDGDGDLDVLTFDFANTFLEYHINRSQEKGYACDSLIFQLDTNGCWGNFTEDLSGCGVNLISCRIGNSSPTPTSDARNLRLSIGEGESTSNSSPNGGGREGALHAGNCSLCIDLDADGDKEILLGQLSCCNFVMLTNGGTPASANMIAKDTTFPSYNIPASLTAFPCGYFVDVNNDNKRDLIVCPNAPNISIDKASLWYYENTGTDSAPIFSRKKRSFLQEDMIDAGEGADPVFFDFDNDGLTDLLISNYTMVTDSCPDTYSYNVHAYKNIGTASAPKFDLVNTDYANLSAQLPNVSGKHLTFGDLDNDGDADMFIGEYGGYIDYFTNTGGAGPAIFTLTTQYYQNNLGNPIDVGDYATPQLIDADRDGDLDLIIGEQWGNLNYYKNIGTPTAASFSLATTSFGGVDVLKACCTGYSVPFMYDSAGSYRLIVGSEANRNYPPQGWLWQYKNIDGNLAGNFTRVDSMYQNIWEGKRMTVNGKDMTGDGMLDLVVGNFCGGVAFYMGDTNATGIQELNNETSFDFSIYPNPTSGKIEVRSKMSGVRRLEIYNVFGELVYSLNPVGNNSNGVNPPFTQSLIDLSEAPNGIYFCKISGEKFFKTKKLIVLK
ncbi:MAG: T9SS type A sorting domain-containing protein [Bacteroidetes bacterium]|nr:T9SS type A sorting domain-containing protein [Bacteroidota bacterium]